MYLHFLKTGLTDKNKKIYICTNFCLNSENKLNKQLQMYMCLNCITPHDEIVLHRIGRANKTVTDRVLCYQPLQNFENVAFIFCVGQDKE